MTPTTELTREEKRVKIAEALGWTLCRPRASIFDRPWISGMNPNPNIPHSVIDASTGIERKPTESDYGPETLPDYFADLNACRQMEVSLQSQKGLDLDAEFLYLKALQDCYWSCENGYEIYSGAFATAAQRAEAFGLTMGLWTASREEASK